MHTLGGCRNWRSLGDRSWQYCNEAHPSQLRGCWQSGSRFESARDTAYGRLEQILIGSACWNSAFLAPIAIRRPGATLTGPTRKTLTRNGMRHLRRRRRVSTTRAFTSTPTHRRRPRVAGRLSLFVARLHTFSRHPSTMAQCSTPVTVPTAQPSRQLGSRCEHHYRAAQPRQSRVPCLSFR